MRYSEFRKKVKEQALMYKGYPCTKDCGGHMSGYAWAERRGVTHPGQCPFGSSNSFWEGCKSRGEGK